MEENELISNDVERSKKPDKKTKKFQKPILKLLFIGILILLLLIPMKMIKNLIDERIDTADDASAEVYKSWSGPQTIAGPILAIKLKYQNKDQDGKIQTDYMTYNVLPNELNINGDITTKELKRSIYEIVVYNSPINISGSFVYPEELKHIINGKENVTIAEAAIYMGISDLRGICEEVNMDFGEQKINLNSGMPSNALFNPGVACVINIDAFLAGETIPFNTNISLKGSKSVSFIPLGKITSVKLSSNCQTPSFTGAFLPNNREVTADGFSSDWKIVQVNRNYPQVIQNFAYKQEIDNSVFGVDVLVPLQHYQKSMRTVKYAILIILLTFVVSFFVEMIQQKDIHPVQYLLIGLALCLFYALLVSMSEHTSFTIAYAIAALMTDGLITCYLAGILKIKKTALAIGGLLLALYAFIFVLLQLESFAMLVGSVGLFLILAILMYYSQRIEWYKQN